jgi:hypothetical protein
MTQGASIPYHLRQNKAIDRNLFIDLLVRIGRYVNISDYEYISFGGPFLEDFKLVHGSLRISKMISIEVDENTTRRQAFNKPISCVALRHQSSQAFLDTHEFEHPTIIWFDYSKPELGVQLAEVNRLLTMLKHGDVFRFTLNASPAVLGTPADKTQDLREYRVAKIRDELAEYAPAKIEPDDLITRNYPTLLLKASSAACKQSMSGSSDLVIQPLTAFVYTDGQQMLTVTGVVLKKTAVAEFNRKTRLKHWPFASLDWSSVTSISVPQLSVKERLRVETLLPENAADAILQDLGYFVGEDSEEGLALMESFARYYRMYPWYSRVVL